MDGTWGKDTILWCILVLLLISLLGTSVSKWRYDIYLAGALGELELMYVEDLEKVLSHCGRSITVSIIPGFLLWG